MENHTWVPPAEKICIRHIARLDRYAMAIGNDESDDEATRLIT